MSEVCVYVYGTVLALVPGLSWVTGLTSNVCCTRIMKTRTERERPGTEASSVCPCGYKLWVKFSLTCTVCCDAGVVHVHVHVYVVALWYGAGEGRTSQCTQYR